MRIYIHIPFCEAKCKYCRFASVGNTSAFLVEKYIAHLEQEIRHSHCPEYSGFLTSIYLGGGTPSILSLTQLEKILTAVRDTFPHTNIPEITLETTPQNMTAENVTAWKSLGINRISMGVQTLNTSALAKIGRAKKEHILSALDIVQKEPTENLSIDFILGLPGVASGELQENISEILQKYPKITHISVYMLEDYFESSGSGFQSVTYPSDWKDAGLTQAQFEDEYENIVQFLAKKGFDRYEISNFAQQGYSCLHNQGYWTHADIVGFGLGSHSYLQGKRRAQSENFRDYYAGKKELEETLSQGDILLETLLFQIRTSGIPKTYWQYLKPHAKNTLVERGFLCEKDDTLQVTKKGVVVLDEILAEIVK